MNLRFNSTAKLQWKHLQVTCVLKVDNSLKMERYVWTEDETVKRQKNDVNTGF